LRILPVISILLCFLWEGDDGLIANERLGLEDLYFACT
jgi:hypothetical protein